MPIIACGINHRTAPVALREQVVFAPEKLALYLQDLAGGENVHEAVLLSTCNRSELYCVTDHPDHAARLTDWFCRQSHATHVDLRAAFYCYTDLAAVQHIMQVACGIDSQILGESQILGQLKTAFSESCAAGTVGSQFNRLFQEVFAVAKEVRTNTAIGVCPVSVSAAAVRFAQQQLTGITTADVLLVGAGLTQELVARHLAPLKPARLTISSRSIASATALAAQYHARTVELMRLPEALAAADIVITATGSPQPIITPAMLTARRKPLHCIDIAVPRDIDPACAALPHIFLYSIDDLRDAIQQGFSHREHAAQKAREVIATRSAHFMAWLTSFAAASSSIRTWRSEMEKVCQAELMKYTRQLQRGENPADVLQAFARAMTQKILHTPSVKMRQPALASRHDMLEFARELFALPDGV